MGYLIKVYEEQRVRVANQIHDYTTIFEVVDADNSEHKKYFFVANDGSVQSFDEQPADVYHKKLVFPDLREKKLSVANSSWDICDAKQLAADLKKTDRYFNLVIANTQREMKKREGNAAFELRPPTLNVTYKPKNPPKKVSTNPFDNDYKATVDTNPFNAPDFLARHPSKPIAPKLKIPPQKTIVLSKKPQRKDPLHDFVVKGKDNVFTKSDISQAEINDYCNELLGYLDKGQYDTALTWIDLVFSEKNNVLKENQEFMKFLKEIKREIECTSNPVKKALYGFSDRVKPSETSDSQYFEYLRELMKDEHKNIRNSIINTLKEIDKLRKEYLKKPQILRNFDNDEVNQFFNKLCQLIIRQGSRLEGNPQEKSKAIHKIRETVTLFEKNRTKRVKKSVRMQKFLKGVEKSLSNNLNISFGYQNEANKKPEESYVKVMKKTKKPVKVNKTLSVSKENKNTPEVKAEKGANNKWNIEDLEEKFLDNIDVEFEIHINKRKNEIEILQKESVVITCTPEGVRAQEPINAQEIYKEMLLAASMIYPGKVLTIEGALGEEREKIEKAYSSLKQKDSQFKAIKFAEDAKVSKLDVSKIPAMGSLQKMRSPH